jgi:hypothetical protein
VESEYVITISSLTDMNARSDNYLLLGSLAVLSISTFIALADDPVVTNTPAAPVVVQAEVPAVKPPPPPAAPATWRAPYGVEEILTLTRAQIGETLVMNYIKNSGTIYNLQALDIVHLRDQGVSERIIGAMLDQKANVIAEAKVEAATAPATAGTSVNVYAAPLVQPAVFALPTAVPPPQSTLHIIPYRAASYAYQTSYRPYAFRPYFNYAPSYYGGWCGGSSVITVHGGFGSHSPSRRGWR